MSLTCNPKTYSDVKKIGQGAYGTIYTINDKYVLKVAKDAKEERAKHIILWHTLNEECKKYFVKPYQLPLDCRPTNKKYQMHAMEKINGVNMSDFIKYNLAIDNKIAIKTVMNQLKSAIMCLWKSGFIHNDLHMKNVLVSKDGIKIIDFGLSEKVTPLKSPKTKKDLIKWFTQKYTKSLNKLGLSSMNPNLYAYGIKKHKMYCKPDQVLYNMAYEKVKSINISTKRT